MDIMRMNGEAMTSDDLVGWLKLSGRFTNVMQDVIKEKLAAAAGRARGYSASPEELQARADQHRRTLSLHRAKDANEFLDEAGLTLEDYEAFLAEAIVAEKLRDDVCSDAAIEEYFTLHAPKFDAIQLSHMVLEGEGAAKEVASILEEEPESFAEIAAEQSLAESSADGGRVGRVMRGSLNPDLEAKLFNAAEGEILGPFQSDREGTFEIFSITAKHDAALDTATRSTISKLLYNAWLETAVREFNVEV